MAQVAVPTYLVVNEASVEIACGAHWPSWKAMRSEEVQKWRKKMFAALVAALCWRDAPGEKVQPHGYFVNDAKTLERACEGHWPTWKNMRPDHQHKWRGKMRLALQRLTVETVQGDAA